MPDFLYAAELKQHYRCFGRFYELLLADGTRLPCRSVLEIVNTGAIHGQGDELAERSPDAVFIMMNPGSSRPLQSDFRPPAVSCPLRELSGVTRPLVPAMPDTTQYQVMRVMAACGWAHVRVLNLSDLRETRSGNFVAQVNALAGKPDGGLHSIFCPQRGKELARLVRRSNGGPVVLAWGQVEGLRPLAGQCLAAIRGEPSVGVCAGDDACLFAHPSPMLKKHKEKWLAAILARLRDRGFAQGGSMLQ